MEVVTSLLIQALYFEKRLPKGGLVDQVLPTEELLVQEPVQPVEERLPEERRRRLLVQVVVLLPPEELLDQVQRLHKEVQQSGQGTEGQILHCQEVHQYACELEKERRGFLTEETARSLYLTD